jgi:hypothetical protein
MSDSRTPWQTDREIEDLRGDLLGQQALLSYLRYNVHQGSQWIKQTLEMDVSAEQAASLYQMDEPRNALLPQAVGERAARVQVSAAHFPACFDPQ